MATLESACQYADDVLAGEVVACKWVRAACQRFIDDLGKDDWIFDVDKANRILEFFPDFIRHVKGRLAGEPYELSDWEAFILINLFGWVDKNGRRRFRTAYIEVARKNSKSTFCSGIALFMTAFDLEGGAEVYSAGTTRDQARIVFGDAQNMIKKSAPLKRVFGVHKLNIHHEKSASKFEPLSSDAQTLDGLNVHCAILDEVHAHKNREVWDVVETATGAREQPLILAITTAGFNKQGVGYEQREYVTKILDKVVDDDTYFGIIFTIDEDDDPFDERCWIKANPNLGRSKKLDDLQRLAKKAQEMPAARNNFLTKHLNVWVNAETAWLDMAKWDALQFREDLDHLKTLPCFIGLDLANKLDVAAVVAAFPDEEFVHVFCKFYLPENTIYTKSRTIGNLYQTWSDQGYLTLTEGDIIDHDYIEYDIRQMLDDFQVKAVGFDPWGSTQLSIKLEEEGAPMVEIPQTVKNLSEAMKEVEARVIAGTLRKDKNPMMDWMASNIVVKLDRNENYFPNKEHPDNKIDGMVALFMAVNRWLTQQDDIHQPMIRRL
ncbi:terminase large subunit [Psychrosphaera sp. 1_MG-2023]|uniref:terminase large subunit n=1 Tax=Psychrosphaera sp. 1_MG-2023 TaxID=3062643 RepID=UPI0026E23773|nr:terminase TerL endonuclease subunit [Psychrosphaera sp. 1_MG-2023]MDO6718823.1 terminase large subunit [Psychrosphaera sp. 1_MG-2023]